MSDSVNEAVIIWLSHQIVYREPTAYNIHQKFIEFRRDLKQARIVGLTERLELIRCLVDDHFLLLFIEE